MQKLQLVISKLFLWLHNITVADKTQEKKEYTCNTKVE